VAVASWVGGKALQAPRPQFQLQSAPYDTLLKILPNSALYSRRAPQASGRSRAKVEAHIAVAARLNFDV
jgi:hypothetical protein